MEAPHLREGRRGERIACRFLLNQGFDVLARRYKGRAGELDIIAFEQDTLVFVEVKKRNTDQFGDALSAITRIKQRHMVKSALWYMKKHTCFNRRVRFDAVGLDGEQVKIVKSAFMVEDDGR